ncbi:MAG: START domain-containing protein [Pseudomonadota bacterium]
MKPYLLVLFIICLIPLLAKAQLVGVDYQWEDKKNSKGITISTSAVEGSPFKAVRGEMTVNASVKDLVALVEDLAVCPEWAALCKEARLEQRISPTESFAYIYNDIPFPVTDRDVYTHIVWTEDTDTQRVTMTSKATEGGPAKTKAVRLVDAVSQWHFTPNDDGTTYVESFAHIDPAGPTPAWITNLMLVDSPFKTMVKMREIVESGQYENVSVQFLENPITEEAN